jgi:hypothetical protein
MTRHRRRRSSSSRVSAKLTQRKGQKRYRPGDLEGAGACYVVTMVLASDHFAKVYTLSLGVVA